MELFNKPSSGGKAARYDHQSITGQTGFSQRVPLFVYWGFRARRQQGSPRKSYPENPGFKYMLARSADYRQLPDTLVTSILVHTRVVLDSDFSG